MGTLDDRNKPIKNFINPHKSIDDCSGEEWSAAAEAYWSERANTLKSEQREKVCLFCNTSQVEVSEFEAEEAARFEQLVAALGTYSAISYCHGITLDVLLNLEGYISGNLKSLRKANLALTRMIKLVEEEEKDLNW